MAQMFKRSEDGAIVCADCLAPDEELTAAALQPRHFPGTYHRLHCARCGAPRRRRSAHPAGAGTRRRPPMSGWKRRR